MRTATLVGAVTLGAVAIAGAGTAEAPPATPGRDSFVGEVAEAAPTEHRLVVRRDGGGEVAVSWDGKTAFLRALPGATSLEGAGAVPAEQLKVGDRVWCRGTLDAAGGALVANRVVVMTRGDVDERRAREQEDWRRRGTAGVVTAVDAATHRVTLRVSRAGVARTVVVDAGGKDVRFRRYPPDSIRFGDARSSSFDEVSVGDQLRVLGDTSADGSQVTAEQVVSGAFRVVRGVVAEVDPAKGTLAVRSNGGPLVRVAVGSDAVVRRLPPMMVMRLLRASETGAGAAGPAAAPGGAGAAPGGGSAGRAPDPDEALERLPAVALADIQKGEEVAVLGPRQESAPELPAIKLAVWTTPSWSNGRGGAGNRSRAEAGAGPGGADPFADVLGVGGETPW